MAKLETETPADLLHYEPPTTIGATKRQLACIGGAVVLGLAVYTPLLLFTSIPPSILGWVLILIALPFATFGWVRPYGLHFEEYLKLLYCHTYQNPPLSAVNERSEYHEQKKRKRFSECCHDYAPPSYFQQRERRRVLRTASRNAYKEIKKQNKAWKRQQRAEQKAQKGQKCPFKPPKQKKSN
jgi:hypothetical protein